MTYSALNGQQDEQLSLADNILRYGKQAFDPSVLEKSRLCHIQNFKTLIAKTSTPALIPVLNFLVQSNHVFEWLKKPLFSALAHLPLRVNGVQDTIDFVLSVHPSSVNACLDYTGGRFCITHEALNAISRLLSSPPKGTSAEAWFNGISPQLLSMLQGDGASDMDKVSAFIIGFGILGRKQYGSPGAPGWIAFVEPIYTHLCPSYSDEWTRFHHNICPKGVETLVMQEIFSTPIQLANSLKMLSNLVTSHPHPSLSIRILKPILYSLWKLSSTPDGTDLTDKFYRGPAKNLLKILLQLSTKNNKASSSSLLATILDDHISKEYNSISAQRGWVYVMLNDGNIQIENFRLNAKDTYDSDLKNIEIAVEFYVNLMKELPELNPQVSALFMRLCTKWLGQKAERSQAPTVLFHENCIDKPDDSRTRLIEATVMQKMIAAFPERLIDNSKQLLELICKVLKDSNAIEKVESKNDEVITISLSLLNVIITNSRFRITSEIKPLMSLVEKSLECLSNKLFQETSRTAGNLLMILRLRDTIDLSESSSLADGILPFDQQSEDKKCYNLAISYLTGFDSPPPVRVQGLELLSNLVSNKSPILDIPALIELLSSLLEDNEEYVHLRVIKLMVQVSHRHPNTVIIDILYRYIDSNEEYGLDKRLRLGEVLQQVTELNSSSLKHETVKSLCQGLLFLGGCRGYRPKTEQRQEKARLEKSRQNIEAEEAWGCPIPQLEEEFDIDASAQDITFQIVSGWESKRGKEDIRIRSSAITVLGATILGKIQDIQPQIPSAALDLSLHILTLERGVEKGVLRRSVVVFIANFVQALDIARSEGINLRFGLIGHGLEDLVRVLEYIEKTDNDDLVRQHSKDAIENISSFSMNSLFSQGRDLIDIQNFAGLSLTSNYSKESIARSKIVEVE